MDGSSAVPSAETTDPAPLTSRLGYWKAECLLQDRRRQVCRAVAGTLLSDLKNECGSGTCQSVESVILGICTYPDQTPARRELSIIARSFDLVIGRFPLTRGFSLFSCPCVCVCDFF